MPAREPAALRYTQAIFAIARDEAAFDRWERELATLRALASEPAAAEFLASSRVTEARKFTLLEQALEGATPNLRRFAKLLVRKGRIGLVAQIVERFAELLDRERGVAAVRIVTAQPLSDEAREAVVGALQRATGASEVRLAQTVEADILGGAIVQIGDHLVDGSVRTRLRALKQSIAGSRT